MAAAKAHNSLNIADLMESLTVSKKEADDMDVEIKAVTRDLSRPNTIASLSRLEAEIDREIRELIKKKKTLEDTLKRDERRMKRVNANERFANERLKLQTDKLHLVSSIGRIDALLVDYRKKLDEVSGPLELMKGIAKREKAKHAAIIKKATKDMTPKDKKDFIAKYKIYLRDIEGITIDFDIGFNNSNSNSNSNGASAAATRRSKSRSPRTASASHRSNSRSATRRSRSRSPSNMPNSPRSYGGATRRHRKRKVTRRK
jgi:hypothetical protein